MAVYDIEKVDISMISPDEIFILDANILFFLYSGYTLNAKKSIKASKYSNFISSLLSNGNNISTSAAYVQETINCIENTEFDLYKKNHPINKKKFRYNPTLRSIVSAKTNNVYTAICQNCCDVYGATITKQITDKFVNDFCNHTYDPMDYIAVENLISINRVNVITDDRDYRGDSRIQVYTIV